MRIWLPCVFLLLTAIASPADARWPWPEDFLEVQGRHLGDRFITEEEGNSLEKQDLCFDCHDGSVLDNRELWDRGLHGHRVDMVPKQPLPEGIPLIDGKLYCGSCHLPHGGLPGTRKDVKKPYMRYENTNDVFCVACHQERATPGPQENSRNHSFLKKAHLERATADPEAWRRIQALGGRVGKEGAVRCQSCHRPHGAPSRSALITFIDKSQLCSICHHDIKDNQVTPNHPLHGENPWKLEGRPSTVECLTCHRVHEAPVPGILLMEEGEELCLHCHQKNQLGEKDIHRQEKLSTIVARSPEKIGAGLCGACHRPHRAKGAFLCRNTANLPGVDPDSRFCAGCHTTGKRWAENQIGPYYHPLGAWPEKAHPSIPSEAQRLPLLTASGTLPGPNVKEKGTLLGCRTCHFMHDLPKDISPNGLSKNLRYSPAGGSLCFVCHPDQRQILETSHSYSAIANPQVRQRFSLQGDDPCSFCHVVHKAGTRRLFPSPLFVTPQTDQESAACLSCHNHGVKKAELQIGEFYHPLGEWPEQEKSFELHLRPLQDLPLYLPVISNDKNGMHKDSRHISCATCHKLHPEPGVKQPPEDYLRSPLTRQHACVICHEGQALLQKTKHYIQDPKLVQDIGRIFGKIQESHECTPCHLVHHASGPGLWFTTLFKPRNTFEQDERSRRCLTCHLHDEFKAIREKNGHPIGKRIKTEYMPRPGGQLKLGRIAPDEAGVRDVIVCATCHLNHGVENPDGSISMFAGGGLPEGELCIACHKHKGQIVGSPHDFRTRKQGEFRPDEGRSLTSGVCAGCHANHDASIDQGLIAFQVSPPKGSGNPEDMFCLYCHRDPRVTKNRWVRFYAHPSGKEVQEKFKEKVEEQKSGSKPKLAEPERTTLAGYGAIFRIRCRTCHDNHQWAALPAKEAGQSYDSEMTDFLRGSQIAQTLCANCHGVEALYRYRFFHQDRAFRLKIPDE